MAVDVDQIAAAAGGLPPARPRTREMIDMPGLLRGVARTAVVAGTATAVSNRVSRRQAGRYMQP